MTLLWVLAEVVAGVLLAGGVTAALVVAGAQWGAAMGPWVAWVTVAVCVGATVAIGERMRRGTRV